MILQEMLENWLDETFNDLYLVTFYNKSEDFYNKVVKGSKIISHDNTLSSNKVFIKLLNDLADIKIERWDSLEVRDDSLVIYTTSKKCLAIHIKPIDDEVHHTYLIDSEVE